MNDVAPGSVAGLVRLVTLTRYLLALPDTRAIVAGGPVAVVACAGDWAGGIQRWFKADTLLLAVEAALVARARAVGDPVTRDDRPVAPGLELWHADALGGQLRPIVVGEDVGRRWWQVAPPADGHPNADAVLLSYADCWSTPAAAARDALTASLMAIDA